jgi:polyhydroxyalkanoate synthesis regulator protein
MKLTEIVKKQILKEEVDVNDVDKVISVLYKNLKKFSKEQARIVEKFSKKYGDEYLGEDIYERLVGSSISRSKAPLRAFIGDL